MGKIKKFFPVNGDFVKGILIVEEKDTFSYEILFVEAAYLFDRSDSWMKALASLRVNLQANAQLIISELDHKPIAITEFVEASLLIACDRLTPENTLLKEFKSLKFGFVLRSSTQISMMQNPIIGSVTQEYKQVSEMYYKSKEPFSKNPLTGESSEEEENPFLDLKEIEVN